MVDVGLVERLFNGKLLIISRNTNALVKLASLAIERAVKRGIRPAVVDETGYLVRYIPFELLDKISLFNEATEACSSNYAVIFQPRYMKKLETCMSPTVLVFSKPTQYHLDGYLNVYVSKPSSGNQFIARLPFEGIVMRFTISDGEIVPLTSPPGIYGKAYDVLQRAMSDYGELNVKDAVRAIVVELGVDKTGARRILLWLARNAYIRVVKGRLSLV